VRRLFRYSEQHRGKKQANFHHNTNSAETKDSFSIRDTRSMFNRKDLQSPATVVGGADLGRRTIFGTLPVLSGEMEENRDY
jgi:hypothetical protein